MIASGPSQVAFGPTVTNVVVTSLSFDLVNHTFTMVYGPPGGAIGQQKVVTGAIPAPLQTTIETHCLRALESSESWAASSSNVVTP